MMAGRAEVLREPLHEKIERARDEDDLVPLGAAALDEVARAGVDGALDHGVERLVGEDEQPVARDALVVREEQLVEPPPVEHFRQGHPRAPERRTRQGARLRRGVGWLAR